MKNNITPLKQTTEFGCLAACYAMIENHFLKENSEFTQEMESALTKEAFKSETKLNEHFYLNKLARSGHDIKILVETPYMLEGYGQLNTKLGNKISISHALIGINDYEKFIEEGYVIITLIDLWYLDMIIHYPHYVVIDGCDENSIFLLDPKYGNEIKFSKYRFQQALDSIKYHLKYSPVLFAIKKSISPQSSQ